MKKKILLKPKKHTDNVIEIREQELNLNDIDRLNPVESTFTETHTSEEIIVKARGKDDEGTATSTTLKKIDKTTTGMPDKAQITITPSKSDWTNQDVWVESHK